MIVSYNTFIKPSKIHGLGLFASKEIKKGERIKQGYTDFNNYMDEWITYVKKWKLKSFAHNNGYCMINHSEIPNTKRDKEEIIAIRTILKGEEITEDYYALPELENPFINSLEEMIYHAK